MRQTAISVATRVVSVPEQRDESESQKILASNLTRVQNTIGTTPTFTKSNSDGGRAATGKFKPGSSGNPQTQFKPGNQYRWQPGQSGNPAGIAASRRAVTKGLETGPNRSECSRRSGRSVDRPASHSSNKLPPGTDLYQGELRIRFVTAAELAAKLSALSEAIKADSDGFAAQIRTVSQPSAPAQQNNPADQLENADPPASARGPAVPNWREWAAETEFPEGRPGQAGYTHVRRIRNAVELADDRLARTPTAAGAGEESRARERLATPAVDTLTVDAVTGAHDAEAESPRRVSLKERYEEFCQQRVTDHLRALPQAIRSELFEEMRSGVRRAVPQLRRDELDEMAQRQLELKIRAGLHLPSIEVFAAGCV